MQDYRSLLITDNRGAYPKNGGHKRRLGLASDMVKRVRRLPIAPIPATPCPGWLRASLSGEELNGIALSAGAGLALLDRVVRDEHPIGGLWRERLALSAVAALARLQGRREDEATLRDHWHLTRPGDDPGPAGRLLLAWRTLITPLALRAESWDDRLPALFGEAGPQLEQAIACARDGRVGQGGPVAAAATVAATALRLCPRSPAAALWLAEAVLAQRLRWLAPVPLLATQLSRSALRGATADPVAWSAACHRAVARGAVDALDLHGDLTRRAERLLAVAPHLRGRDADRTVSRLLSEDALAAGAGPAASDRSGRRLFDRLVALGGVRELTGRASFRLYGL